MADNGDARILNVPSKLKKVASRGQGRSFEEIAAAGDKVVERVSMNYRLVVEGDVQELVSMCQRMRTKPGEIDPMFKGVFRVAHDIKGQAGTFGYPLITRVAGSLTAFIERFNRAEMNLADHLDAVTALIDVHVNTLQLFVTQDTKGQGGPYEAKLLEGLTGASERTLAKITEGKA